MPQPGSPHGGLTLRTRLILRISLLVGAVLVSLSSFFIWRHTDQMSIAAEDRARSLRDGLADKGLSLARNVAVASERTVLVNDFLMLNELVTAAVNNDDAVLYGLIMRRNGQAVVHTRADEVFTFLKAPLDQRVAASTEPATFNTEYDNHPVVEATAPVFISGEHWGAVRFGLSLAEVKREVAASRARLGREIALGVASTLLGATVLLLVGSLLGAMMARSISQPLQRLTEGVRRVQTGDFTSEVSVQDIPEFVGLAQAFNVMSDAVLRRERELERALEAANEANRVKTEFLANISHELRTPLNAIVNIPTILLEDFDRALLWRCDPCDECYKPAADTVGGPRQNREACPECGNEMTLRHHVFYVGDPEEHYNLNRRAAKSSKHLLRLVNDLLDFSKLQAGRMDLFLADVDLGRLFEELDHTLRGAATDKDVALRIEPPPEPVELRADGVKVSQVLINLVGNAVKFTESGGTVRVWAELADLSDPNDGGTRPAVKISVQDTGVGIAPDSLELVFERFRQADGSHTRRHGGTGLGLAISKQLVELHGGSLHIESEVGKGSTFCFILPLQPDEPVAEPEPAAPENSPSVLVVDDDRGHLEVLTSVLQSLGCNVRTLEESVQAVDLIQETLPDLIILDVMMPYVSGLTVLCRIREIPQIAQTPVIVSSGYPANQEVVERLGAHWIAKPWAKDDILRLVSRLLTAASESGPDPVGAPPGARAASKTESGEA